MPSRMYEYPLPRLVDELLLFVPTGSKPKAVGIGQGNRGKVWFEVPQGGGATVVWKIRTVGTFKPIPEGFDYIGTYSASNTVFHVYGVETTAEAVKAEITHSEPVEKTSPTTRTRRR